MADRGAYILDDGTFARTQADAKGSGQSFEKTSIPVDSAGLITFLNELIAKERANQTEQAPAAAEPPISQSPPAPQIKVNTSVNPTWAQQREAKIEHRIAIDEEILEADYEEARRIQSMATERMVEHIARMQKEEKASS